MNLLEITKAKKTLFSSRRKALQAARVGTVTGQSRGLNDSSGVVTHVIKHGYNFIPYVEAYGGYSDGYLYRLPYPMYSSPLIFLDLDVDSVNITITINNTSGQIIFGDYVEPVILDYKINYFIFADNLLGIT